MTFGEPNSVGSMVAEKNLVPSFMDKVKNSPVFLAIERARTSAVPAPERLPQGHDLARERIEGMEMVAQAAGSMMDEQIVLSDMESTSQKFDDAQTTFGVLRGTEAAADKFFRGKKLNPDEEALLDGVVNSDKPLDLKEVIKQGREAQRAKADHDKKLADARGERPDRPWSAELQRIEKSEAEQALALAYALELTAALQKAQNGEMTQEVLNEAREFAPGILVATANGERELQSLARMLADRFPNQPIIGVEITNFAELTVGARAEAVNAARAVFENGRSAEQILEMRVQAVETAVAASGLQTADAQAKLSQKLGLEAGESGKKTVRAGSWAEKFAGANDLKDGLRAKLVEDLKEPQVSAEGAVELLAEAEMSHVADQIARIGAAQMEQQVLSARADEVSGLIEAQSRAQGKLQAAENALATRKTIEKRWNQVGEAVTPIVEQAKTGLSWVEKQRQKVATAVANAINTAKSVGPEFAKNFRDEIVVKTATEVSQGWKAAEVTTNTEAEAMRKEIARLQSLLDAHNTKQE